MSAGAPIDLSFFDAETMEDLIFRRPRRNFMPYLRSKNGRYYCAALRLNNNLFTDTRMLPSLVSTFIEQPDALGWLDLSCNQLEETPYELLTLPGLRIIYLHGNNLTDLNDLLQILSQLPHLFGLTLHGNPFPSNYRYITLAKLKNLKALDFSNVTNTDRTKALRAIAKLPVMWQPI